MTELAIFCYRTEMAMNVSLTEELEQRVEDRVRSGMYGSASEVVREALRLFFRYDEARMREVDDLDRRIGIFFKQGKDEEEELEAYFGDLVDKINKIYDILEDGREVIDAWVQQEPDDEI